MDADNMIENENMIAPRRDCMIYVHAAEMHVIVEENGQNTADLRGTSNVYVKRCDGIYDVYFQGEILEADRCGVMQMWGLWRDLPVPEDPQRRFTPLYRVVADPEVEDLIEQDTHRMGVTEMCLTREEIARREALREHYTSMARAKEFAEVPEMFTPVSKPVFVARRAGRIKVYKNRPDLPGWSIKQERTLELRYAPWKMRSDLCKRYGIPEGKRW